MPTVASINSHIDGNNFPCIWEPSPQSSCSLLVSPQAPRPQCVMSQRPTEPYLPPHPNGQVSSSACRQKISLLSMSATTLDSHQLEGSTAWLQMLVQIYFGAAALALWPNGLMTTSFSGSPGCSCQGTTLVERVGSMTYRCMEGAGRMGASCGMEGKTCATDPWRSLTRTAAQSSLIWLMPPPIQQRTTDSPTQMLTLTSSPRTLESDGNPPSLSPSGQRSRTLASAGTYVHAWSTFSRRRESSTWRQSWNGRRSACTTSWTPNGCMESCSMPRWSYLQGEPTSPTWRPCWPSSIIVHSYHTPLHATLQLIYSGGDSSSPALTYQGPSTNPIPPPTTVPTPMPALVLPPLDFTFLFLATSPMD